VPQHALGFLEGSEKGDEIFPGALSIESWSKRLLETSNDSSCFLDPENHGGVERIEVEEPSLDFHREKSLLHHVKHGGYGEKILR
jgi:hypothetical protein